MNEGLNNSIIKCQRQMVESPLLVIGYIFLGFPGSAVVKNLSANAGGTGDTGSIPVSGRSHEGQHGNPLQDSCLENAMDRGA